MGILEFIFGSPDEKSESVEPNQDRIARVFGEIKDGYSCGVDPALIAENEELLNAVIRNLSPEDFDRSCRDDISYGATVTLSYVIEQGFEKANLTGDKKREIKKRIQKAFLGIIESDKYYGAKLNALGCFWYLTMEPDKEKCRYCVKFLDTKVVACLLRLIDNETDEKSIECAFDSLYSIWKAVEGDAIKEFITFLIEQQDKCGEESKQLIARILTKAVNSKTCESFVIDVLKKNIEEGGKSAIVVLKNLNDDAITELKPFLLDVLTERVKRKDGKDEVTRLIVELLGKVLVKDDEIYQMVYTIATDPEIDFTPIQNSARQIIGRETKVW